MFSGYFINKLLENGEFPCVIIESSVKLEILYSFSSSKKYGANVIPYFHWKPEV